MNMFVDSPRNKPLISIVSVTFNPNLSMFEKSLQSIRMQNYPKNRIEHLIMDAGSTNGVFSLGRQYNCRFIVREDLKARELVRQSIGITQAKGEVLLILETDNVLTSKDWLEKMIQPFIEHEDVFSTFSAYYGFEKDMSALTRYTAFFGTSEPTLYYLQKTEKIPLVQESYDKGEILEETSDYYVVRFTPKNLPTCGDNGHMVLREAMNLVNNDPYTYTHLDAIMELVKKRYTTFGVVKNSIIHIGKKDIIHEMKRKIQLKNEYFDSNREKRKYLIFDWKSKKDRKNLLKYVIYSLTFIVPVLESIRGYIRIRDFAWFLHPLMCFFMVIGYGISEIRWLFKLKTEKTYMHDI